MRKNRKEVKEQARKIPGQSIPDNNGVGVEQGRGPVEMIGMGEGQKQRQRWPAGHASARSTCGAGKEGSRKELKLSTY